ncbi:hypothetical protein BDW74DRAFT_175053 [Aspergillus multicolor]|uniref:uncharacterized protein n=1 Tax=Aspergillus multicolor TaxID=41759 RepID=UPI003CCCEBDA
MFSIPTDVSDEPAAQPPPGVESNFIDPPSLQPAIVLLEAVFTPLILLAVAIRVYVRTRVLKLWGWEDTTCLLALCGSIANLAMVMKCMFLGIGRHMWNVPLKIFLDPLNNRILAVNITYPWAVCFAKLSILLLYKRLFPVGHEKIVIWVGLILISVLYATFITLSIVNIAICTDIYSQVSFFCAFAYRNVVIWTGTVNVATDLYVIVLLINQFRKLQMSLRRKVGLCCIFALGIGACAASIARLVIIVKNMDSTDSTWVSAELSLFTITEINIGIIVSCVFGFLDGDVHTRGIGFEVGVSFHWRGFYLCIYSTSRSPLAFMSI